MIMPTTELLLGDVMSIFKAWYGNAIDYRFDIKTSRYRRRIPHGYKLEIFVPPLGNLALKIAPG